MPNIRNTEKDFWNQTRKTDSCWIWTGSKTGSLGYGRFGFRNKYYLAHRLSWEFHFGEIPKGMQICHHCDNPLCVNPDHLFMGTQSDNIKDAVKKGRMKNLFKKGHTGLDFQRPCGENCHFSKLKLKDIIKIKELLKRGIRTMEIASKFGLSQRYIYDIKNGEAWKHIYL